MFFFWWVRLCVYTNQDMTSIFVRFPFVEIRFDWQKIVRISFCVFLFGVWEHCSFNILQNTHTHTHTHTYYDCKHNTHTHKCWMDIAQSIHSQIKTHTHIFLKNLFVLRKKNKKHKYSKQFGFFLAPKKLILRKRCLAYIFSWKIQTSFSYFSYFDV